MSKSFDLNDEDDDQDVLILNPGKSLNHIDDEDIEADDEEAHEDDKCATSIDVDNYLNDDPVYSDTEYYPTKLGLKSKRSNNRSEDDGHCRSGSDRGNSSAESRQRSSKVPKELIDNNQTIEHCLTDNIELSKNDLGKIYSELNLIHHKLMKEFDLLQDRELELKKRECEYLENEIRLNHFNEFDVELRFDQLKVKYENDLKQLENELKESKRENKRLNEAFKSIKQTNDTLKSNNVELQDKNSKLEKQYGNLNNRLINLQRKLDYETKKLNNKKDSDDCRPLDNVINTNKPDGLLKRQTSSTTTESRQSVYTRLSSRDHIYEATIQFIDIINELNLKTIDLNMPLSGNNFIIDKFSKILPNVYELVKNPYLNKFHFVLLKFIYWSLLHCDVNQKMNYTTIYRHIGEELYKPFIISTSLKKPDSFNTDAKNGEEEDVDENEVDCINDKYTRSKNPAERLLSCLIILRALNQSHLDYLINIFDLLKNDLKLDANKELFLNFYGVWSLLKWCKLANKPLLTCSVDILLQLSIDSCVTDRYLQQCSNETWFSHISVLMRHLNQTTNIDLVLYEKLSVLLQKLSKIKTNRKYFEMFTIQSIIQELMNKKIDMNENDFLYANLKSILFNLNHKNV